MNKKLFIIKKIDSCVKWLKFDTWRLDNLRYKDHAEFLRNKKMSTKPWSKQKKQPEESLDHIDLQVKWLIGIEDSLLIYYDSSP